MPGDLKLTNSYMHKIKESGNKRDNLLTAALTILARRGFHGFSMKQLADEAHVAAGTTYLYFNDKEHLIEQLHDEIIRQIADEFFIGHDLSAPIKQQFNVFCQNYWRFCMREKDVVLSKAQFDHLPQEVLFKQRKNAQKIFKPLLDFFNKGRMSGEIKDLPDEVLIGLSIETLALIAAKVHLQYAEVNDEVAERTFAACWDAIAK